MLTSDTDTDTDTDTDADADTGNDTGVSLTSGGTGFFMILTKGCASSKR